MIRLLFSGYNHCSIDAISEKLHNDYYIPLEALTKNARRLQEEVQSVPGFSSAELYLSLCGKFLNLIESILQERELVLLPYIRDLSQKESENHNCGECEGNCSIRHAAPVNMLRDSHQKLKEMLYRLQMVALPLYSDNAYPPAYQILRNEIMLIDTTVTELFYIEEAVLLPKITKAQHVINAYL